MKKKLSESSFASLDRLEQNIARAGDEGYLATHGVGYYSSDGNYYWVRTGDKPTASEYQDYYWDSTINVSEFMQEYEAMTEAMRACHADMYRVAVGEKAAWDTVPEDIEPIHY